MIDPDGRSEYKPEYKEPLIDLHTGEITNVLPDWYNQKVDRVEQPKYITSDANESDKTTRIEDMITAMAIIYCGGDIRKYGEIDYQGHIPK